MIKLGIPSTRQLLIVFLLLGYGLFSILTLTISPYPAGDEAFYAQIMETHAETGAMAHPRVRGVIGMDVGYPLMGKLYIAMGSYALRTGLSELWVLRLVSFLALASCLVFIFLWLKTIYDGPTALLAVVLLKFSTPIFIASHTVRSECLDLALFSVALYCAQLSFRDSGRLFALFSGLAAGSLLSVHLGSAPLILVVGVWWLLEYRLKAAYQVHFWMWVLGVGASALLWLYWHVLPNTDLYMQQLATIKAMLPSPVRISVNPFYWFGSELLTLWRPYGYAKFGLGVISLGMLAFGLVQIFVRKDPRDYKLASAALTLFVLQSLLSANRYGWYVVFYLFFFCPILAAGAMAQWKASGETRLALRWGTISAVILYLGEGGVQIASKVGLDSRSPSLSEVGKIISAEIPKDSRTCASAPVYFTKPTFEWVDAWFLQFLQAAGPSEQERLGATIRDAFEKAGIGYIVAHSDHDSELAALEARPSNRSEPSQPFDRTYFVRHHTRLVRIVDSARGGRYVIRQIVRPTQKSAADVQTTNN